MSIFGKWHTEYHYGISFEDATKKAKEICRQLAAGGNVLYNFEIKETKKGLRIDSAWESVAKLID